MRCLLLKYTYKCPSNVSLNVKDSAVFINLTASVSKRCRLIYFCTYHFSTFSPSLGVGGQLTDLQYMGTIRISM